MQLAFLSPGLFGHVSVVDRIPGHWSSDSQALQRQGREEFLRSCQNQVPLNDTWHRRIWCACCQLIARWGDGSCPEPRQGSRSGGWRRERATGWVLPGPKRQQCPTAPTISPAVKRRWKEFMETGASRQPWQVSVLGYAMLCRMPCSDQSTESRCSSSARAATQRSWRDGVVKLLCVC